MALQDAALQHQHLHLLEWMAQRAPRERTASAGDPKGFEIDAHVFLFITAHSRFPSGLAVLETALAAWGMCLAACFSYHRSIEDTFWCVVPGMAC